MGAAARLFCQTPLERRRFAETADAPGANLGRLPAGEMPACSNAGRSHVHLAVEADRGVL